jgi:hypothetical protein
MASAQYVHQKYEVPTWWWAQTVTVGYESRASGTANVLLFEASKEPSRRCPTARRPT